MGKDKGKIFLSRVSPGSCSQGDKRHDQSNITLSKIKVKIGGVLSALRLPVQHHMKLMNILNTLNVMIKCGE